MAEIPSFGGGGFGGGAAQAGGAIGGLLGSVLGDAEGKRNRRAALRMLQDASRRWTDVNLSGTPDQEQLVELGPSAIEGVSGSMDPATRQAQLRVLGRLMEQGMAGGLDAQSRATQAQAMAAAAQQDRARQGALMQEFAARGMGGSNAELGARLAAQGRASSTNALAGLQASADAQQRAAAALMNSAALAGNVRGADYGQAMDLAAGRDRVAEYNARNRQGVGGRNVDRVNQGRQQQIDNRFRQAAGYQGAIRDIADWEMTENERKKRFHTGVGQGIGTGVGAAAGAIFGG